MTTAAAELQTRLASEAEHFDRHYQEEQARGVGPLSSFDRTRYAAPSADTVYPREYFFHLLNPKPGMKMLEIACGNGIDASIAAVNGADVFAYDLSPQAIDMTRRRAAANGVSERVHTMVSCEIEDAFSGQTFDAITGYAALHHLPLQGLGERVCARLKPGGVAVFAEPVVNSDALARLRNMLPIRPADVTPDERPLNDADITELARSFGGRVTRREFQCVSRVYPLLPQWWPLIASLHHLDAGLMRLPALRKFASVVVFSLTRA